MTDKKSYHKTVTSIVITVFIILGLMCFYAWNAKPDIDNSIVEIWITRILLSGFLLFLLFISVDSAGEIGPNEIGIILQFGKPMFQVGPGFIWLPIYPVWRLHRETSLIIEEQYPEDERTTNGKVTPIYITHGTSHGESVDPLDNRITTAVSIVCRYKVVDLIKFVTSIGDKEQLRRQIRDIVVTTAQVECAKETVGANYNRLPEINSKLKLAVEDLTKEWGIDIVTVLLQNIDLGGAINDALSNVPVSIINKEVNKNNSQKIYYEGLAQAEVHKAFQFAKAEGYKIIAKELDISEPVVIYQIDTLANMWRKNNADVNLYSGDLGEVFKMVTAFSKITSDNSSDKKLE